MTFCTQSLSGRYCLIRSAASCWVRPQAFRAWARRWFHSIGISRVDSSTLLSRYSKREGMSLPLTEPYVRFSRIRLFKKSSVSSSRYPSSGAVLKCNSSRFAETSDISISPFGHGDSAFGKWSISDISKSGALKKEVARFMRIKGP